MSGIGRSVDVTVLTGNQNIDGLLGDVHWSSTSINYSFPTSSFEYDSSYTSGVPTNNFASVSSAQQTATYFGLDADIGSAASAGFSVEGFTNLNISLTTGPKAAIRLAQSDTPSTAFAFFPGSGYDEAGDVWFGTQYAGTIYDLRNPEAGNYAWHTLIHELGHALGLEHGHEGGAAGPVPAAFDALEFTLMTYRTYVNGPLNGYSYEEFGAPQTFMMLDIAALQELYGADYTTNSGDTVYSWNPSSGQTFVDGVAAITPGANRIFATIWDGGGTDTYDLSAYTTNLTIDLSPGESSIFSAAQLAYLGGGNQYASGNIYNALMHDNDTRSLIENAVGGSGDDTIVGNQVANELRGNSGDDTLDGGAGVDTAVFGGDFADYDISLGLPANSYEVEDNVGTDGTDTLSDIERLEFDDQTVNLTQGSNGVNNITGTINSDVVFGRGGDDRINASLGIDRIYGGAGDDKIIGGGGADLIDGGSNSAAGDTASWSNSDAAVQVNLATALATGGHAEGDTLVDIENLFGSSYADTLNGDSSNNTINGFTGDDVLSGGTGGANNIIGGSGNDTFVGGSAADSMSGGSGFADLIDYSSSSVGVIAHLGGDYVFDLGDATGDSFSGIENLTGSDEDDSLVGTQRKNIFIGNDGDDFMNAAGGSDELYGGAGNDTMIGGVGADIIDGGTNGAAGDTARYVNSNVKVIVSLTDGTGYSGHAAQDTLIGIENLFGSAFDDRLTGDEFANKLSGHNGADKLYGEDGDDTLIGGNGNDVLYGGADDDTLTGSSGIDRFVFDVANFGNDTITDFANGSERMDMRALDLSFSDLTITQSGGDTVISVNGATDTITLENITTIIDASDFIF